MLQDLRPTADQAAPLIDASRLAPVFPGLDIWDTWPLRDREGEIARVGGWTVWISLTAPNTIHPEARHHVARLRVACVGDDHQWRDCGPLFPDGASLGSREWAGSAVYDAQRSQIIVFYTAAGRRGDEHISYEQRIVMARGSIGTCGDGVTFSNWEPHRVILEPDGVFYRATRGTTGGPGQIEAFRDPGYFVDPVDGTEYLLFTGSLANARCPDHDGAVGIARASETSLASWELLPPLLHADCVNKELERPHFVLQDGSYYLFFSTHAETFAPGITGCEGLFGFVAPTLYGPYEPLNGSGLVVANPQEEPLQAYSWLVLNDGTVLSFANYVELKGRRLEDLPSEEWRSHFGGTQAPLLRIELAKTHSRLSTLTETIWVERPSTRIQIQLCNRNLEENCSHDS